VSTVADLTELGRDMGFDVLAAPLGTDDEPSADDIAPAVAELARKGADIL